MHRSQQILRRLASGSTVTLSDGKATFTWEGTDPDSGDTLSYTVYVDKVDGKQTPASALTNLSAQTADVELDADTTYYWRVKSSDGTEVEMKGKGRHDPCVVPRAVPIVEAMAALVIVDYLLINNLYK